MENNRPITLYDPSLNVGDKIYYENSHTNGSILMKIIKTNKIGYATLAKDDLK